MALVFSSQLENDADGFGGGTAYGGDGVENNFSGVVSSPTTAVPPQLPIMARIPSGHNDASDSEENLDADVFEEELVEPTGDQRSAMARRPVSAEAPPVASTTSESHSVANPFNPPQRALQPNVMISRNNSLSAPHPFTAVVEVSFCQEANDRRALGADSSTRLAFPSDCMVFPKLLSQSAPSEEGHFKDAFPSRNTLSHSPPILVCLPQDALLNLFAYAGIHMLNLRATCRTLHQAFLLFAPDHLRAYLQPPRCSWTLLRGTNAMLRKERLRRMKAAVHVHRLMQRRMRQRVFYSHHISSMNRNFNSGTFQVNPVSNTNYDDIQRNNFMAPTGRRLHTSVTEGEVDDFSTSDNPNLESALRAQAEQLNLSSGPASHIFPSHIREMIGVRRSESTTRNNSNGNNNNNSGHLSPTVAPSVSSSSHLVATQQGNLLPQPENPLDVAAFRAANSSTGGMHDSLIEGGGSAVSQKISGNLVTADPLLAPLGDTNVNENEKKTERARFVFMREWLMELMLFRRTQHNIRNALFDYVTVEKQSHAVPLILPNGTVCFSRWHLVAIFVRTVEKDDSGQQIPNTSRWIKTGYLGSHVDTVTSMKYDGMLNCLFTSSFDGTVKRWGLRDELRPVEAYKDEGLFSCLASYKVTINGQAAQNFNIFSFDIVHLKDYKLTAEDRRPFTSSPMVDSVGGYSRMGPRQAAAGGLEASLFSMSDGGQSFHSLLVDETLNVATEGTGPGQQAPTHPQGPDIPDAAFATQHAAGSTIEVLNGGSSLMCCGSEWGAVALLHIDGKHSATLGVAATTETRVRQIRFLNTIVFDDAAPNLAEQAAEQRRQQQAAAATAAAAAAAAAAQVVPEVTSDGTPLVPAAIVPPPPQVPPPTTPLIQQGTVYIAASTFGGVFIMSHVIYRKVCEVSREDAQGAHHTKKGYHFFSTTMHMTRLYFFHVNELPINIDVPRPWWHRNPNVVKKTEFQEAAAFASATTKLRRDNAATQSTSAPMASAFSHFIPDDATDSHPYFTKPLILLVYRRMPCIVATLNPDYAPVTNQIVTENSPRPLLEKQVPSFIGGATCGKISPSHAFFVVALDSGKVVIVSPRIVAFRERSKAAGTTAPTVVDSVLFGTHPDDVDDDEEDEAEEEDEGHEEARDDPVEELHQQQLDDDASVQTHYVSSTLRENDTDRRDERHMGEPTTPVEAEPTPVADGEAPVDAAGTASVPSAATEPSQNSHLAAVREFFGDTVFDDSTILKWQTRNPHSDWDHFQFVLPDDPSSNMFHIMTLFNPSVDHVFQPVVNMDLDGWKLSTIDVNSTVMVFDLERLTHVFTLTLYPAPHHNIFAASSIEKAIVAESRARPPNPKYVMWHNSTMLVSPLPITSHTLIADFSGKFFSPFGSNASSSRKDHKGAASTASTADDESKELCTVDLRSTDGVSTAAVGHSSRRSHTDHSGTTTTIKPFKIRSNNEFPMCTDSNGDEFVLGSHHDDDDVGNTKVANSTHWLLVNEKHSDAIPKDYDEGHFPVTSRIIQMQRYPFLFHSLYIFAPPVVMLFISIFIALFALRIDNIINLPFAVVFVLHFILLPHYFGINAYSFKPLLAHHSGLSFHMRVVADLLYLVLFPVLYLLRVDGGIFSSISWMVISLPLSTAIVLAFAAARIEDAFELRHLIALDPVLAKGRYRYVAVLQAVQTLGIVAFILMFSIYFDNPLDENSLATPRLSIFVVFLPIWLFLIAYAAQLPGLVSFNNDPNRRVLSLLVYYGSIVLVYAVYIAVTIVPLLGFSFHFDHYYDCALHPHGVWGEENITVFVNATNASTTSTTSNATVTLSNDTNATFSAAPTAVVSRMVLQAVKCGSFSMPLIVILVPVLVGLICVSAFATSNVVTHVRQLRRGQ